MNWVLNFIKEYKLRYYIANVIIIVGTGITKILPIILLGKMIDVGIYEKKLTNLVIIFCISVRMFIAGRIISYIGILIIDKVRYLLANKLKIECYKKLNELDSDFYKNNTIGEITTILTTDVHSIHNAICYVIKQAIGMLFACFLAIVYCMYLNPFLTICILLPTPVIAYISKRYIKNTNGLYDDKRKNMAKLNGFIQENIEANRLIKTLVMEESEIESFKIKNKKLLNKNMDIKNENIEYESKIHFLSYLMQLILFFVGGIFVMKEQISIGEFIVINSFMSTIKKPFIELSGFLNEWQQFKVAVSRTRKLLETENKIKDDGKIELKNWNNIEFRNVTVNLENKNILNNLEINIEKNKTYAFIGEIGSGKSSVGKLLLRLIDKSSGKIYIDNIPIEEYSLKSLRNKIGYVSQTPFLFSDSIANNVLFGNKNLNRMEIEECLKLAKADYCFNLSNGIDTIIGENGISLSGGEKQRLSLARAIAKKPSILMLDDITSALDFETELDVTKNINSLNYECTKIIIAQKIISVKNADTIFVMKKGKIVEQGSHEELLKMNGEYYNIYNIQRNNQEENYANK